MQDEEKKAKNNSIKSTLIESVKVLVIAGIIAFLVTNFLIVNAKIPTGSMRNTIIEGDRIVASRLSYMFSDPEREDIMVFKYPDDESKLYIKRVIGLPGETVNIIDGKVYIDNSDTPLDEPYVNNETPITGDFGPYTVPEDSYFMLGDNRNDSIDSRYWDNTFVHKDQILGKAMIKYFPKIQPLWNK